MTEVQRSVHVWVGKVSKPLWVFLLDLVLGEATDFILRGSGGLEETIFLPSGLVFLFQGCQMISFPCLNANERLVV